ncbi:MAG: flagellar hook-associated protein FlgK [Myxococcota bacterium]|jgi:flagellar hook-associated protein 1 FlgK|nr:flagellar hook-associated protein FlgK [Myxococcota bacterium]
MAGLFGALDLSARALGVTQKGLGVTAHNIANVNTPGYTRQRQAIEAALPLNSATGSIGTGVEQRTIERVHDSFIQARLIQEHASQGSLEQEVGVLSQLDSLFNEQGGDGITPQLSRLYDSFSTLAAASEPDQPNERANLIGVAQTVVATFNRFDSQMTDLQRSTDSAIVGLLPEVNKLLEQIAALNQEIAKAESLAPANDLRDEQERLIRDLASKMEISTIEDNQGLTTVMFEGGIPLVEGQMTSSLLAVPDPSHPFDPTFSSIHVQTGNQTFDVTSRITGGELGGLLLSRDVHIADARNDLDALAFTLAQTVNDQHSLGFDLNGAAGGDFFSVVDPTQVSGAAGSISVATAIENDHGAIAAAGLASAESGDTANADLLAGLRSALLPSYQPGDLAGAPSGLSQTVIQQSASMISSRGRASELANFSLSQQNQVLGEIQDRRDEISGVSLDEEVTDLIRLQSSYQANARVISTVNEMLNQLTSLI